MLFGSFWKRHTHTLMDMRTDLIAVPHAGLGFQFLRVQVRKPKRKWRSIKFSEAINARGTNRTIDRQNDVVRSHLQCKKTSKLQLFEVLGLASRHS